MMVAKEAGIERRNASLKTFDRMTIRLTDDADRIVAELAVKDYDAISGLLELEVREIVLGLFNPTGKGTPCHRSSRCC